MHRHIYPISAGVSLALALQPGSVSAQPAPAAAAQPAEETAYRRVTPFVEITKVTSAAAKIFPGSYTRLEIEAEPVTDGAEVIGYNKRPFGWRLAVGKKYEFTSVLKVSAGRYTDTIPLFQREYESSRKVGESFKRSISYDRKAFPLFLASTSGGGLASSFTISGDMTETTDSRAAALGLDAFRTALKAVAPESSVLTTLSKESTDKVAAKVDEQASKLFATSVAEALTFDIDMTQGDEYTITLYGPYYELDSLMKKTGSQGKSVVAKWTVRMAGSRPSIFTESHRCASSTDCTAAMGAAYTAATRTPASVLEFKLLESVGNIASIRGYLTQQEWWVPALDKLKADAGRTVNKVKVGPDYDAFCRQIRTSIAALGLNDLDGRIIAYSVGQSALVGTGDKTGMERAADCKYS